MTTAPLDDAAHAAMMDERARRRPIDREPQVTGPVASAWSATPARSKPASVAPQHIHETKIMMTAMRSRSASGGFGWPLDPKSARNAARSPTGSDLRDAEWQNSSLLRPSAKIS